MEEKCVPGRIWLQSLVVQKLKLLLAGSVPDLSPEVGSSLVVPWVGVTPGTRKSLMYLCLVVRVCVLVVGGLGSVLEVDALVLLWVGSAV